MTKAGPRPTNSFTPPREKLIDRQIREAMDEGKFDELPYQGERIPLEDESAAGDWAIGYHLLRNARFAPPWIETDKEVRALLARRDAILDRAPRASAIGWPRDERELREVVELVNRAIFRLNHEAPTVRQHRRLLDLEAELAALRVAHRAGDQG
jgi:DnaJ homolog subfamily C member 28